MVESFKEEQVERLEFAQWKLVMVEWGIEGVLGQQRSGGQGPG